MSASDPYLVLPVPLEVSFGNTNRFNFSVFHAENVLSAVNSFYNTSKQDLDVSWAFLEEQTTASSSYIDLGISVVARAWPEFNRANAKASTSALRTLIVNSLADNSKSDSDISVIGIEYPRDSMECGRGLSPQWFRGEAICGNVCYDNYIFDNTTGQCESYSQYTQNRIKSDSALFWFALWGYIFGAGVLLSSKIAVRVPWKRVIRVVVGATVVAIEATRQCIKFLTEKRQPAQNPREVPSMTDDNQVQTAAKGETVTLYDMFQRDSARGSDKEEVELAEMSDGDQTRATRKESKIYDFGITDKEKKKQKKRRRSSRSGTHSAKSLKTVSPSKDPNLVLSVASSQSGSEVLAVPVVHSRVSLGNGSEKVRVRSVVQMTAPIPMEEEETDPNADDSSGSKPELGGIGIQDFKVNLDSSESNGEDPEHSDTFYDFEDKDVLAFTKSAENMLSQHFATEDLEGLELDSADMKEILQKRVEIVETMKQSGQETFARMKENAKDKKAFKQSLKRELVNLQKQAKDEMKQLKKDAQRKSLSLHGVSKGVNLTRVQSL